KATEQGECAWFGRLRLSQLGNCASEHRTDFIASLGRDGQSHTDRLAFEARRALYVLAGELLEETLQLARQGKERIPGTQHDEIVAAHIDNGYLTPEIRECAEQRKLTGEKLLEHDGQMNVLFGASGGSEQRIEVV